MQSPPTYQVCSLVFGKLVQTRDTWEEENLDKKLYSSGWPVGMFLEFSGIAN